jgi:hypothetical protein
MGPVRVDAFKTYNTRTWNSPGITVRTWRISRTVVEGWIRDIHCVSKIPPHRSASQNMDDLRACFYAVGVWWLIHSGLTWPHASTTNLVALLADAQLCQQRQPRAGAIAPGFAAAPRARVSGSEVSTLRKPPQDFQLG